MSKVKVEIIFRAVIQVITETSRQMEDARDKIDRIEDDFGVDVEVEVSYFTKRSATVTIEDSNLNKVQSALDELETWCQNCNGVSYN